MTSYAIQVNEAPCVAPWAIARNELIYLTPIQRIAGILVIYNGQENGSANRECTGNRDVESPCAETWSWIPE